MSGGSVKGSERYDIYIGSRAALTVKNTQVGGTVLNLGKITGQGSAEFTGTVENSGYAVAEITGCKIHRIEHRSPYKGTITGSTWDEYVYLLGRSWPTAKIPSEAGEASPSRFKLFTTGNGNSLEIPKGSQSRWIWRAKRSLQRKRFQDHQSWHPDADRQQHRRHLSIPLKMTAS